MRTRGVKQLDPVLDTVQIDWLVVPAEECQNEYEEGQLISRHFRKPHEPWTPTHAFVMPVCVRRSRRKVLFLQQSGVG
jgi:hypothetical protein